MSSRHPHSFPPLGDGSRFDVIVSRGRALRRRRQIGAGAGAGSALAATALAVVLLAGVPTPKDDMIVADENTTASTITTTTTIATTTTTTTALSSTTMTVRVDPGADSARIVVTDPAQPMPTAQDAPAQQCVLATLSDSDGRVVAEESACTDLNDPEAVVVLPLRNTDPQIDCGSSVERIDPIERATRSASTTFELTPPPTLTAGGYELTIAATSGIGDGCANPTPDPYEAENSVVASFGYTIE